MANSTFLSTNLTNTSLDTTAAIVHMTCFIIIVLSHCTFLYFVIIILRVFFTSANIRETARYVLFIHMILNDTLYLIMAFVLYVASVYYVYIPVPFCYIMLTISTSTFRVTPYNLAVMSLERYVAVCYPLSHSQLCSPRRSTITLALIWTVALLFNLADIVVLGSKVGKNFFSLSVICSRASMTRTTEQGTITLCSLSMSFSAVGLIILYTYIQVVLVARKIGSGKSSAFKAGKTIMLHAFQLMLCMMSFTSSVTETYLRRYQAFIGIINYLLFMCLPRLLSPLIYGLRDDTFRKYMITFRSAAL
ncbi:PREDICTED: olfactory receptor 2AT4-like [Nanorana parkeri]|uniref:olfactory receptor 2AT4-like n=1 Tax=Nanorana parkeri TaxID=125878 RepID=UPI000854B648|nr:PREDICTED: olfactory receptor 2AT4-like [Nanorana parkeri]